MEARCLLIGGPHNGEFHLIDVNQTKFRVMNVTIPSVVINGFSIPCEIGYTQYHREVFRLSTIKRIVYIVDGMSDEEALKILNKKGYW